MKSFVAALALVGAAAAMPAPASEMPAGCMASYSGSFEITVVNVTQSARRVVKRDALVLTLQDGVLKDAKGRTGYIASNDQFQFDGPPQAGAKITSGFSACANGSLALGDSAIWYQCLSGTFYNLYDMNDAAQCSPVYIDIVGGASTGGPTQSQQTDGQPTGSPATTVASEQTDGQVTETPVTTVACEIGDGQPQFNTCTATAAPVSEISDGQPQAPTARPVSQISDGQPQASTAAVSTAAPVSQISDGQPQAPTSTAAPVSQISDGQPQAPTGGPSTYSNGTAPTMPSVVPYTGTGAAPLATLRPELFGLAAGILAVVAL